MSHMVEIDEEEFLQLQKDQRLLECLRAAGVDNWDGWDYAIEMFTEGDKE